MRKRVAVVGATGIAGQQFLVALAGHPWFEVAVLAASERSAGKTYAEALRDPRSGARRWWCLEEPPAELLDRPVERADGLNLAGIDIVFAAVDSDRARVVRGGGCVARAVPDAAVRQDDARPQHRLRLPRRGGRADPGAGGESGA